MVRRPFILALVCLALIALLPRAALAQPSLDQFNGWAFEVNRILEQAVVRPGIASFERNVSARIKSWLVRAYGNLTEPVTATAHAIDGDLQAAVQSSARFVVNSTLGLGGAVDFAAAIGMPKRERTFTRAICGSGLPLGAFVILPVIGPTTTGVALAAVSLMLGSTAALSLISVELAAASVAIDVFGAAAALQSTVAGTNLGATYEDERRELIEALRRECGAAAEL